MKRFGVLVIVAIFASAVGGLAGETKQTEVNAVITIGDGVASQGDINGKALPLAEAVGTLPESGGLIAILPGDYEVGSALTISKPNVALTGAGNSTRISVKASGEEVDFVRVAKGADGFTLRDCSFLWTPKEGERALIRCEASEVRMEDCLFQAKAEGREATWASCVSVGGEGGLLRNIFVSGNSFSLGQWSRGLRLERTAAIHVTANRFEGNLSGPAEGIYSRNCNQQQFTGNSFNGFGTREGQQGSTGLFIDNNGGDVGHLEITGNHFHTFFGPGTCALKCERMIYATITGNVFGRCQGWGNSAVYLSNVSATSFVGNQIENSNSGEESAVVVVSGISQGVSIVSNNFTDNYITEVGIVAPTGTAFSVVAVVGNLFDGQAHSHRNAIEVKGDSFRSLFITGNVLTGYVEREGILCGEGAWRVIDANHMLSPVPFEVWQKAWEQNKSRLTPPKAE